MKPFRVDIGVPESHGVTITVKARGPKSAYTAAMKALKKNEGGMFDKDFKVYRIFYQGDVCYDYLAGFIRRK